MDPDQTFVEPLLVPGRVERGARLVEGRVPGPDEDVRHPGHHPGRADRRQVALELLTLPENWKDKMRALFGWRTAKNMLISGREEHN